MQNWRIIAAGAIVELRSLDLVRETYLGNRQGRPRSPGGATRSAS
jgi:hypothetical protein